MIPYKIKTLPKKPGIYVFKNSAGKIIYIGKALSLKNRIDSYFKQKPTDLKTKILISQIHSFDHQVVVSEFDALLLEAKLIKEHQPRYNVRLKDNKRYLYIAITKPPYRIFPVRRPELEANLLDWFGPFPSSRDIRLVLQIIRKSFPFCSEKKPPKRECFYKHLNLCPGFQKLNSLEYKQQIKRVRQIFSDKGSLLIMKNIGQKMKAAARKKDFETAQKYKNQFLSLQRLTQTWRTIPMEDRPINKALLSLKKLIIRYQGSEPIMISKIEAYDISNLGHDIIVGSMVAFIDGQPEKSLYRRFRITPRRSRFAPPPRWPACRTDKPQGFLGGERNTPNDPADIAQIIDRRLNHHEWVYPQLILVDGGKTQVSAAFQVLKNKNLNQQIAVLGLTKEKEIIVIPRIANDRIVSWAKLKYSSDNSVLKLLMHLRDEAHRFSQNYYKKLHLKKLI